MSDNITSSRIQKGITKEGLSYELILFFTDESDEPVKVMGIYNSKDGGGDICITQEEDGTFVNADGYRADKAYKLLPHVI